MAAGSFRVVGGSEDFLRLAARMKDGERKANNGIRRRLRTVAKPLGVDVRDALADSMPNRGGLSARVAGSRVAVTSATSTHPRVEIRVRTAEGYDLEAMNAGSIRHPVFGRGPWVGQSVPAGAASRALQAGAPMVRTALMREVEAILDEIGD